MWTLTPGAEMPRTISLGFTWWMLLAVVGGLSLSLISLLVSLRDAGGGFRSVSSTLRYARAAIVGLLFFDCLAAAIVATGLAFVGLTTQTDSYTSALGILLTAYSSSPPAMWFLIGLLSPLLVDRIFPSGAFPRGVRRRLQGAADDVGNATPERDLTSDGSELSDVAYELPFAMKRSQLYSDVRALGSGVLRLRRELLLSVVACHLRRVTASYVLAEIRYRTHFRDILRDEGARYALARATVPLADSNSGSREARTVAARVLPESFSLAERLAQSEEARSGNAGYTASMKLVDALLTSKAWDPLETLIAEPHLSTQREPMSVVRDESNVVALPVDRSPDGRSE